MIWFLIFQKLKLQKAFSTRIMAHNYGTNLDESKILLVVFCVDSYTISRLKTFPHLEVLFPSINFI